MCRLTSDRVKEVDWGARWDRWAYGPATSRWQRDVCAAKSIRSDRLIFCAICGGPGPYPPEDDLAGAWWVKLHCCDRCTNYGLW
jgi:hypothetical protein